MPTFGQPTVTQIIGQVSNNSAGSTLDLTNNATFKSKSTESMQSLADALKRNTTITTLILRQLELADAAAASLADALQVNQTIENLDLSENNITAAGAISIADGLANNTGVKVLNLMTQKQAAAFGEEVQRHYVTSLETNLTLTKIVARFNTKNDHLAKKLTRNFEVDRCKKAGLDYSHIVAAHAPKDGSAAPKAAPEPKAAPAPAAAAPPQVPAEVTPMTAEPVPAPAQVPPEVPAEVTPVTAEPVPAPAQVPPEVPAEVTPVTAEAPVETPGDVAVEDDGEAREHD